MRPGMRLRQVLVGALTAVALTLGFSAFAQSSAPALPESERLTVLAYHDISDNLADADRDAVSTQEFSAQMTWLKAQGYTVISAQAYLDAKAGLKKLPPKPVLLTFDDGYASFYTHAYPILRTLQYPSVLAIIGSWQAQIAPLGEALSSPVDNGHGKRLALITPEQLREIVQSGLVELASHSFDLHHGIVANPQGSLVPSASAKALDQAYESEEAYAQRLEGDLRKNSQWLKANMGKAPRLMVWPYGSYTTQGLRAAKATGHVLSFGLDEHTLTVEQGDVVGRIYITGGLRLGRFGDLVRNFTSQIPARRHVSVRVTAAALTAEGLSNQWLGNLVQSVYDSGANLVLLSPFMEPQSEGGNRCNVLFPTKSAAMTADVLSKISWQLQVRAHVSVMLDVATKDCSFTDDQWRDFVTDLVGQVPSHGLAVRVPETKAALASDLAKIAYSRVPAALTASTASGIKQSFQLKVVDACSPSPQAPTRGSEFHYEVDASRCDGKASLERLLRAGVRDFGTFSGTVKPSGGVAANTDLLMFGLLSLKSS